MISFEREYPGTVSQARQVRADLVEVVGACPLADDLALLASELATNAIQHSQSGQPGGTFTVRAILLPGECALVEVVDQGGTWTPGEQDDEHGRGLAIVAAIAGGDHWGIGGDEASRVAWFQLDWPHS